MGGEILNAALHYAGRGWPVFPVRRKTPLTQHGFQEASTDPPIIRKWWERWPSAGVAIATGAASGLVVIDIDPGGEESLWALVRKHGPLLPTLEAQTPRGGRHLYFSVARGQGGRCSAGKLGTHLDVRGEGGYTVAPPSQGYTWINELVSPAPLPDWLAALIRGDSKTTTRASTHTAEEKIREGRRNDSLTRLAGAMRRRGASQEAIEAALLAENSARCEPPLSETEVERIVASVSKYAATQPAPRKADEPGNEESGPYSIEDGRIFFLKDTSSGLFAVPLSNFIARITEEIMLDDGREKSRAFSIEGVLKSGKPLPLIRVPAERFSAMNWVAEQWGARAVVSAGLGARDRLREAIQRLSGEVPVRRVFTHTGWAEVNGVSCFLTATGAVGAEGVEVDLPTDLARYALPREAEDARGAMEASLQLLDIAPLAITAPLWAGIFRAPLASAFPLDLSLFVDGPTGALKSTLGALFLSHFGSFERTSLPGSWSSTANQLEHRAFLLKDVPFVVDDYAPSPLDARELEGKAARLLRAQGNLLGRARLRSDLSERNPFPPRGLVISTGEQHPIGQSVLARTLIVRVEPGAVNLTELTEAQAMAVKLRHAMAAYVAWLGPQMGSLPALLSETFTGARSRAHKQSIHLRVPEALAQLWLGAQTGLLFAEEIGAISHERGEELREKIWIVLLKTGENQSRLLEGERPTRRFIEVLQTLLVQGQVFLLPKNQRNDSRAAFIGWCDENFLFLVPEAAFQAVVQFCRSQGEPFPTRRERLFRDLKREGITECEADHTTQNARVGGEVHRVLKVKKEAAESLIGEPLHTIPCVPAFS